MGDHAGDHGHGDHDLALDRAHWHVRLSCACRSIWAEAGADLGDPGLFDLHRPHRLLDRLDHALDLQFDHADRAGRREPSWHVDGHRDGANQMARHRLGRPRRRLSVRLHAVLACRPCRGAAMGMALALLPRHPASVARALDPHRHQGKPTLRARHHADAQGGAQEATRYPIAGARIPARNADRLARLLLLSLHLARLVGLDAVYLATEKKLGFQVMGSYLSIWMFCAIFAYWICGWLCDIFGRRWVIPAFAVPAAGLLIVMGHVDSPSSLFWVGLATNFLITGSFGTGLGYTAELFPTQIRGTGVGASFTFGLGVA